MVKKLEKELKGNILFILTDEIVRTFIEETKEDYDCPSWFNEKNITVEIIGLIYCFNYDESEKGEVKFYNRCFESEKHSFPYDLYNVVYNYFDPLIFDGEYELFYSDILEEDNYCEF